MRRVAGIRDLISAVNAINLRSKEDFSKCFVFILHLVVSQNPEMGMSDLRLR